MLFLACPDGRCEPGRTCIQGMCYDPSCGPAGGPTAPPATGTGGTGNCVDKAQPGRPSDCPNVANLCNNQLYYDLMTEQCPKTCGRCNAQTGNRPGQTG
ncbi:ShTK domain containing protein, partial [Aphelenchoides avenae]